MDDVSAGPEPSSGQSPQPGMDAQSETQRDLDRGLAGIEAKPFSASTDNKDADAETTSAETDGRVSPTASLKNLISGRRNAGR